MENQTIINQQPLRKCGNFSRYFSSALSLLSALALTPSTSKNEGNNESGTYSFSKKESLSSKSSSIKTRMMTALAARVDAVRNSKKIARAFPRFIVGVTIIIWVAPYADLFYTRFDINDRVPPTEWYYESYNWLFLCLGPYMKSIAGTIGIYLCLVYKPSIIKSAVIVFYLAYDAGKIAWLLQITNHDEYNAVPSRLWLYSYGVATAGFLLFIIELLAYWLNHRVLAIKARLKGLRNIADKVDAQVIVRDFVKTIDADDDVRQFQNA